MSESAASPVDLRADVRATIHRLNNLLTTIVVSSDSMLLTPLGEPVRGRAEAILHHALDAERELQDLRRRVAGDE